MSHTLGGGSESPPLDDRRYGSSRHCKESRGLISTQAQGSLSSISILKYAVTLSLRAASSGFSRIHSLLDIHAQ
ncbi:hypothetical protein Y032_0217g2400 [Ancylostoma ceylanicum]|nr:hypothetical protein Y032_0217g2400 [Ancylostoma ceylanicum]